MSIRVPKLEIPPERSQQVLDKTLATRLSKLKELMSSSFIFIKLTVQVLMWEEIEVTDG